MMNEYGSWYYPFCLHLVTNVLRLWIGFSVYNLKYTFVKS